MKRVILITAIIGLLLSGLSHAFVANDPSNHTPNARVIGLGRAYVAGADDIASVYTNPAGLASVSKLQLSSMFGQFVEEYNYTSFTAAYPTQYGVLGFGYSGSAISGAPVTRIKPGTENTNDPIYEVDPTKGSVSNVNNVLVLSYGSDLERFIKSSSLGTDKVKVGANLNIFQAGLSGGGISKGNASGMDLDVGAQAELKDWLKVGVVGKHVLPVSMGGKLVYEDGHTESYPASVIFGTALKVPGRDVTLFADIRSSITQKNPSTMHIGVEWKPVPLVALRVGLDDSNLAAGVGVYAKGFRFDYGYHQFTAAPGVSNNYFSISYGLPVEERKIEKKEIVEPAEKLELIRFKDVPESHWAYNQISLLATQGLVKGYPDQTFKPSGKVTRAELAAILVRSSDVKLQVGKHIFKDVSQKSWAYDYIYTAANLNIVNGYPGSKFKPLNSINRSEGITMISRFADIAPVKYVGQFNDVKSNYWAARYIGAADEAGLLQYIEGKTLSPKKDLTRAEVVEILYRTKKVQGILALSRLSKV